MEQGGYARIVMKLEAKGDVYAEAPWGEEVGDGRFRIDNPPIWYYGIAWGDIVRAEFDEGEQLFEFRELVKPSGYRLVRILFGDAEKGVKAAAKHLAKLERMGCDYEHQHPNTVCVNIPPAVDLEEITTYLDTSGLRWELAAPHREQ